MTRGRNSLSTLASNPGSSNANPIAYFQLKSARTVSAACRSVRFFTRCKVINASRPGDQPGSPSTANSASANNSPSSSRTRTSSGGCRLPRYMDRIAAAITGSGSGQHRGRIDTDHSIHDREEGGNPGRALHGPGRQRLSSRTYSRVSRVSQQDPHVGQTRGTAQGAAPISGRPGGSDSRFQHPVSAGPRGSGPMMGR